MNGFPVIVRTLRAAAKRLKDYLELGVARVFVNYYDLSKERVSDFDKTITHRVATRAEILRCCDNAELDLRTDEVDRRFDRGWICIASYDREQIVGYDWYSTEPIQPGESPFRLRLPEGLVQNDMAFVLPRYRGRGIGPDRWRFAHRAMASQGFKGSIYFIEVHNFRSLAAARKMSTRQIGYLLWFRVFGRHFCWTSRGCRSRGVVAFDRARDAPAAKTAAARRKELQ
jgi:GNAT superfamily N-acetyltransferase